MRQYQYNNSEFELKYDKREFVMDIFLTGYLDSEGCWNHVSLDIQNVREWKNDGEYLDPVIDEDLIKEIESSIDSNDLLEEEGQEV